MLKTLTLSATETDDVITSFSDGYEYDESANAYHGLIYGVETVIVVNPIDGTAVAIAHELTTNELPASNDSRIS